MKYRKLESVIRNIIFSIKRHKNFSLVNSKEGFVSFLNKIKNKDLLGIDTEFEWRNTYYPRISLIQIVTDEDIFLIDCLNFSDYSELKRILEDENKQIIFHSARSDCTVLSKCLNIHLKNVFDIQVAEGILTNKVSLGYGLIVRNYFSSVLNKSETNSNWLKRPLTKSQIKYAYEDVLYLLEIYKVQLKKLSKDGLLPSCIEKSALEAKLGNQDLVVSRLKKIKENDPIGTKIFLWRENIAKQMNIPPSHVVKDKLLKRIRNEIYKDADFYFLNDLIKNEEFTESLIDILKK